MRSAEAAGLETGLNRDEYDAPVARHIHWGRSRRRANAKDARLNERVRSKRVKAGRTSCARRERREKERERETRPRGARAPPCGASISVLALDRQTRRLRMDPRLKRLLLAALDWSTPHVGFLSRSWPTWARQTRPPRAMSNYRIT